MNTLRCKPDQLATVEFADPFQSCSMRRLGCVVKVGRLVTSMGPFDVVSELFVGPSWELAAPLSCPHSQAGCCGITQMPDACLQPFDPDSEPVADEDAQPAGVDLGVEVPAAAVPVEAA